MNSTRRDFLKNAAFAGAAAATAGCVSERGLFGTSCGAPMQGYAAAAMPEIRLGIVGMGNRGQWTVERMLNLPGVTIAAICDVVPEKIAKVQKRLAAAKRPPAKEYLGPEAWKRLCEDSSVNVVYNTTPWNLHVPVQLGAMRSGKHVFTEVPSAFTVEECWELVETSEKTRCHCMQLENCCYGEIEMLTFNLAKLGMLGELVHGEGAYIHDLRCMAGSVGAKEFKSWRIKENARYGGNRYPTHGLVPLCLTFDVNRGDRLDYLVSIDSVKANMSHYMKSLFAKDDPRVGASLKMADMNSTLIKTALGRSLLIQHDVVTPRPYSRIQFVSGTKGAICDYPYRVVFEESVGKGAHSWFDEKKAQEIREKYRHPLWKTIGRLAKKVGGHGGMDFIMDARWVYCLKVGLPLDMDVYDLAATCCLCELTEKSVDGRARTYDIPDFTRGAWRTTPQMGIVDIDPARMGLA